MELEINTVFCLPPNLCTTIISAVSTALGIGFVYCFCITSRRSIGAENSFGLEFFLYLFFCPGPFISHILMTRVIIWPVLSIFLKWNIARLELAQDMLNSSDTYIIKGWYYCCVSSKHLPTFCSEYQLENFTATSLAQCPDLCITATSNTRAPEVAQDHCHLLFSEMNQIFKSSTWACSLVDFSQLCKNELISFGHHHSARLEDYIQINLNNVPSYYPVLQQLNGCYIICPIHIIMGHCIIDIFDMLLNH